MTVDTGELPELVPIPPGERLTDALVWDESTRPQRTAPAEERTYSHRGRAAARSLKQVHEHLRRELAQIRQMVDEVARGRPSLRLTRGVSRR